MPNAYKFHTDRTMAMLVKEALAFHSRGLFLEAEQLYRTILKREKNNTGVLTLLGTLNAQRGDFEEAVRLISLSLKINRRRPLAHNSIGNAFRALRRHDEALSSYDKAIALKVDF